MNEPLSAADVAAVSGRNYGNGFGFGGDGLWLFAILALMGGGFWGNRNNNGVTEADLCNANSFTDLKNGVRNISDQIGSMNIGFTKGLCDMGYTMLGNFNSLERQVADCCCTTQRAVDSVKFDMANYSAGTNAAISAGIQKVLDKMAEDKAQAQAQRINNLELQQALCGVVRYPTSSAFFAANPFLYGSGCGNGCGYGNI